MPLVAGGTGRLGTAVVELLIARGIRVRVMTRDPARAQHLDADLVEVVKGDVSAANATGSDTGAYAEGGRSAEMS